LFREWYVFISFGVKHEEFVLDFCGVKTFLLKIYLPQLVGSYKKEKTLYISIFDLTDPKTSSELLSISMG